MVLYKRKEIRFIVSIAVLLFFPLFCNAAATEEPEEEILFITSYNSDTKYTYDNISTFIETYTQLGGRYSTIVENMNATDLTQHGAVSFILKMRNINSFLFSAQWHHATASVFRRIQSICGTIIL